MQPVMHPASIIRTVCIYAAATAAMRPQPQSLDRRTVLQTLALAPLPAQAATFADAPLVPRSLVVNCGDVPATAAFLSEALGMTVTAEKGGAARASFGPTALERPKDFVMGLSSFDVDGGHFSLELQPAKDVAPASPETDAVLYVQIALPLQFRASRMVTYGGELRDGYGAWSVGAPGGLPLRLLVGFLRRPPSSNCASTPSTRRVLDDSVEVSRRRVGPASTPSTRPLRRRRAAGPVDVRGLPIQRRAEERGLVRKSRLEESALPPRAALRQKGGRVALRPEPAQGFYLFRGGAFELRRAPRAR